MLEIRGVIHVHSTHSRDGEMELTRLAQAFRDGGCHFVAMTEHAEDLSPETMAGFVERCRALSTERFCLVPGLEIDSTEGLHLLGIGLSRYVGEGPADAIIAAIHGQGGLAVLAHPKPGTDGLLRALRELPDGIELWNTKYDSRFAPRLHRFAMLRRLRGRKPALFGCCSVDFHWPRQYREASVVLRAESPAPEAILRALRAGRFVCEVGTTRFRPDGRLSRSHLACFGLWACYARPLLLAIKGLKRAARTLGLRLPKQRLRAILLRVT